MAIFSPFSCIIQKNVVILWAKVQRRGLEGGKCPLSESQCLTQDPSMAFDILVYRRQNGLPCLYGEKVS